MTRAVVTQEPIVTKTRFQTLSAAFMTRSRMTASMPGFLHDAAEAEGGEGDELRLHHAHQPAPRQELVHDLDAGLGGIARVHGLGDRRSAASFGK